MNKKWEFYNLDEEKIEKIASENNISKMLASILLNRGLEGKDEIQVFLSPTRKNFHDPYLMPDMEKAVDRIEKAISKKEKTIIYGDYDVDGITSITVLSKFLNEHGLITGYYIPNRLDEGYGLNKEAIKKIADDGYKLIITVDCGISSVEEVKYAYELGMEVIITDHHEPLEKLPNALAIIDCKRKDNTYPFNSLAGVGVAFKLIQALSIRMNLEEKAYLKYLDIVCIGTISDIVPLVNENRVIAKLGLLLIQKTKSVGLKKLLSVINYEEINSNAVSFGIAPRINACGRMGHAEDALKLFLTEKNEEAEVITEKLEKYNRERQDIEKRIFEQALSKIEEEGASYKNAIILGGENWHHGVIGIVSSKITDLYNKPSILICFEGEEGKGSGRSIPGFDLHGALCKSSDFLSKYGGHEMAVGLSLTKSNFENFINKFNEIAEESCIKDFIPVVKIDNEICLKDMTIQNVKELLALEPYGEANKTPIFIYKNLKIDSIRALSEGRHLKLTLKDGNFIVDAIGFNMGSYSNEFLIGDKIDVIGILEINKFNGRETVQINLRDIRKSY